MRSVKRQQTTDSGAQTPGRQSLDPGQRSVVSGQWSRIRKDAMRYALCLLGVSVDLRLKLFASLAQSKADPSSGGVLGDTHC